MFFSIGGSDTYEKILFAGSRFLVSASMIFIFCIITGRSLKVRKEDIFKVAFLGFLQTSISMYSFI